MKDKFPYWHHGEEIKFLPTATFVVVPDGRVGLYVRFTGHRGTVQFGAGGPARSFRYMRPADKAEVKQAGLRGVGGEIYSPKHARAR